MGIFLIPASYVDSCIICDFCLTPLFMNQIYVRTPGSVPHFIVLLATLDLGLQNNVIMSFSEYIYSNTEIIYKENNHKDSNSCKLEVQESLGIETSCHNPFLGACESASVSSNKGICVTNSRKKWWSEFKHSIHCAEKEEKPHNSPSNNC